MPFDLQTFRAQLEYDGARPNQFQVIMPFPTAVIGGSVATEKMSFFCRTAQLPGETMGQVPVFYFGREIKVPGNKTFQDWTLTILNDEDFVIRTAFERWMGLLNSHRSNLRDIRFTQANDGYATDATIIQWGKTGSKIRTYRMVGAWPMDLAPIDVDWSANDTIEEFTITLAFQWWEVDGENTAAIASSQ